MSNYKTVFFTLGILLIILGVAMLVPVVIQLIYDEFDSMYDPSTSTFIIKNEWKTLEEVCETEQINYNENVSCFINY